jgi:hypothetical protein
VESPPIPTVVLDPYLLITMPTGTTKQDVRLAVCDHLSPGDFLAAEYTRIMEVVNREKVTLLAVNALEITDLMSMRPVLVLYQIATIAAARSYQYLFASDCAIFRRMALKALNPDQVLSGTDLCQRFSHN